MRMVSNRHVNGASMRRFKRVHVQHKVLHANHQTSIETEQNNVPEIVEAEVLVDETNESVIADEPRQKSRRKKKMVETVENNEEKPEYNG